MTGSSDFPLFERAALIAGYLHFRFSVAKDRHEILAYPADKSVMLRFARTQGAIEAIAVEIVDQEGNPADGTAEAPILLINPETTSNQEAADFVTLRLLAPFNASDRSQSSARFPAAPPASIDPDDEELPF